MISSILLFHPYWLARDSLLLNTHTIFSEAMQNPAIKFSLIDLDEKRIPLLDFTLVVFQSYIVIIFLQIFILIFLDFNKLDPSA